MKTTSRQVAEIAFAITMILTGGVMWWGSQSLPPPSLEPIGPAAFPQATAVILVLLALATLAGAILRPPQGATRPQAHRSRHALAVVMLVATIAYLAVMELEVLGFRPATVIYLLVLGLALFDFDWRRRLPATAAIAVIIGVGAHYAFTRLFFLDLP